MGIIFLIFLIFHEKNCKFNYLNLIISIFIIIVIYHSVNLTSLDKSN